MSTYPGDERPRCRVRGVFDVAATLALAVIGAAWDWAIQRANEHHARHPRTPLDVLGGDR